MSQTGDRLEGLEPLDLKLDQSTKIHYAWAKPLTLIIERESKLGTGNYGAVWKAKRCDIGMGGQKFAAKVMLYRDASLAKDTKARAAVDKYNSSLKHLAVKEATLVRKLKHRHIMKCHGAYRYNQGFVVVYELAKGGDLFDYISEDFPDENLSLNESVDGDLPWTSSRERTFAGMIRQLAEVLKYLHEEKKIIHRDIKPENILFKNMRYSDSSGLDLCEYSLYLCDFGLAVETANNKAAVQIGTVPYAAPEVFVAGGTCTEKVDMWSLGVTTYVTLTKASLFHAQEYDSLSKDQEQQIIIQKIREMPIILDCPWAPISQTAKDFIYRCLDRNPATRMSAKEALQHKWLKGASSTNIRPDFDARSELVKGIRNVQLTRSLSRSLSESTQSTSKATKTSEASQNPKAEKKGKRAKHVADPSVEDKPSGKFKKAGLKDDSITGLGSSGTDTSKKKRPNGASDHHLKTNIVKRTKGAPNASNDGAANEVKKESKSHNRAV